MVIELWESSSILLSLMIIIIIMIIIDIIIIDIEGLSHIWNGK